MIELERVLKVGARERDWDFSKPILIVTVGLPRSGKSTWAKKMDVPIVCPDYIRLALHGRPYLEDAEPWVWAMTKTMVKALFMAGHYVVILDAANGTMKRRADWINPMWHRVFKIIPTDSATCIQRARATGRLDLIPIIDRMFEGWKMPGSEEGPILSEFTDL
jgi:predicted kinase